MIFDTNDALSMIILWIVFGYLTVLLNCDIQRLLMHNPAFLHLAAIAAFFFLFTTLDPNNNAPIYQIAAKTLFVYVIFLLITKSKWYFALPVLFILLIDQAIKRTQKDKPIEDQLAQKRNYKIAMGTAITLLVVIGTFDYARLQKLEYKKNFSWYQFFFGLSNRCKKDAPIYARI